MKSESTDPHDWCDKFDEEAWDFQERREEMIYEVYQETFDMRAVVILRVKEIRIFQVSKPYKTHLIRHNHQTPIP